MGRCKEYLAALRDLGVLRLPVLVLALDGIVADEPTTAAEEAAVRRLLTLGTLGHAGAEVSTLEARKRAGMLSRGYSWSKRESCDERECESASKK